MTTTPAPREGLSVEPLTEYDTMLAGFGSDFAPTTEGSRLTGTFVFHDGHWWYAGRTQSLPVEPDLRALDAVFEDMAERGWVLIPEGHTIATVRAVFLEARARLAAPVDPGEDVEQGDWSGWVYAQCNLTGHPSDAHWHPPVGETPHRLAVLFRQPEVQRIPQRDAIERSIRLWWNDTMRKDWKETLDETHSRAAVLDELAGVIERTLAAVAAPVDRVGGEGLREAARALYEYLEHGIGWIESGPPDHWSGMKTADARTLEDLTEKLGAALVNDEKEQTDG
jgi:hypothetical protein